MGNPAFTGNDIKTICQETSRSYLVQTVASFVHIGPEEVFEPVEDLCFGTDQADVLTDGAASGVLEVLDGLDPCLDGLVILDELALGGTLGGVHAAAPAGRLVVVVVTVVQQATPHTTRHTTLKTEK